MMEPIVENAVFEKIKFGESPLKAVGFENGRFLNCDFSGADLPAPSSSFCGLSVRRG
ncbi:MAG: hypothetical protein QUS35_06805 [bacterium]|nr:hypothetical protein [bacterium]